jgi:uncharacterized protein YndB with AHSA1/START domain
MVGKPERAVIAEATIDAPQSDVWQAWSTEAGVRSFFAPACRVELRLRGAYEMYFDPAAPEGRRGGEGMILLAIQEPSMLSFTWNAPPELPSVRPQLTHVTVRLRAVAPRATLVRLHHDGWGEGGEWDEAFRYFESAWREVVLPRLRYRFAVGPVDWANRPDLTAWR